MTPTERYARNFAKVVYHEDHLDSLDDTDRYQIARLFNTFDPYYHEAIAEYPVWMSREKNITPRDKRRIAESYRKGDWPWFMFSHPRIKAYLRTLYSPEK